MTSSYFSDFSFDKSMKCSPILTCPDFHALGRLVISQLVHARSENDALFCDHVSKALQLFRKGDWGDLDEHDWQSNIDTCKAADGGQLLGCYKTFDGTRLWILTAGYGHQHLGPDYCYTTVLFPQEY